MANNWGGKRPGSGRPKGSPSLKSEALAARLDALDYDPAEALVRLGQKAEAAGETELAIKAAVALMSFRWPRLKESSIDLGLGLSGSLADRLQDAQARLQITVVSGIDRPPDDPGAIEADPVPPSSPPPPSPPPAPPSAQASSSPAMSPPEPRPAAAAPPPPAPPSPLGQPMPAHAYWSRKREPEPPAAVSDYDPWKI
jgi:hypothetical protein